MDDEKLLAVRMRTLAQRLRSQEEDLRHKQLIPPDLKEIQRCLTTKASEKGSEALSALDLSLSDEEAVAGSPSRNQASSTADDNAEKVADVPFPPLESSGNQEAQINTEDTAVKPSDSQRPYKPADVTSDSDDEQGASSQGSRPQLKRRWMESDVGYKKRLEYENYRRKHKRSYLAIFRDVLLVLILFITIEIYLYTKIVQEWSVTFRESLVNETLLLSTELGDIEYVIEERRANTSETTVAIHGSSGGFDQGMFVMKSVLGSLAYNATLVSWSRPGYLRSTISEGFASPRFQAVQMHRLLMHLNLTEISIVAYSEGCQTAIEFAREHGHMVRSIIFLSCRSETRKDWIGLPITRLARLDLVYYPMSFMPWWVIAGFSSECRDERVNYQGKAMLSRLYGVSYPYGARQAGSEFDEMNMLSWPLLVSQRRERLTVPVLILYGSQDQKSELFMSILEGLFDKAWVEVILEAETFPPVYSTWQRKGAHKVAEFWNIMSRKYKSRSQQAMLTHNK